MNQFACPVARHLVAFICGITLATGSFAAGDEEEKEPDLPLEGKTETC